MVTVRLPTPEAVAGLLTNLIGRRATAKKGPALAGPAACAIATYVEVAGGVAFLAFADVAFIAGVGAALAMIPCGVVDESISAGKASDVLVENAYEVLNIMAALFNDGSTGEHHVKIKRLTVAPHAPERLKFLRLPDGRLDLVVSLPGYPDGKLTIVATNQTDRKCES
jgi:hypothetical protein